MNVNRRKNDLGQSDAVGLEMLNGRSGGVEVVMG